MLVLTFHIGGRTLGMLAEDVREVAQVVEIAPLPGAPAGVEGAIRWRGAVVPVYDLRHRLGIPPRSVDPDEHLVVSRAGPRLAAFRVDAAGALIAAPDRAWTDAERLAGGLRCVRGVLSSGDGVIVVQDLEAFLDEGDLEALARALEAARAEGRGG